MKHFKEYLAGSMMKWTILVMLTAVPFWASAAIIVVPTDQPTIQDAINAAAAGDTVLLESASSPFVTGLVTIPATKTGLILSGNGSVISSTSLSWGLSVEADNITIEDLTVDGAGTFGIITGNPASGGNNLTLINVSVINGGGTGFALTGVNDVNLVNVTSMNNGGNGMSLTAVQNVTINEYTSSGNMFGGGFSAGIGIFSSGSYTPCNVNNVSLTGILNISEPVGVYVQPNVTPCGSNSISNVDLGPFTHYFGLDNTLFYYQSLAEALTAADLYLQAVPGDRDEVYVGEEATGNKYVAPAVAASDDLSIQAAIDYSVDGDTVFALAGTITEGSRINVDRDITLVGAGKNVTTLSPGFSTGTSGDTRGWFVVQANVEFNMSDLTLDGTGWLVWQAVRHKGFGTFDNIAFDEIEYNASGPNYQGVAIAAFGNGNVDVTNSMFTNIGRVGVLYFGNGINGALFQNNMYTGKGDGDFLDYALDISNGAIVDVIGNTISGNRGVASVDGSASAGILVSTFFGPGTQATITNNILTENTIGIAVGFDVADASTVVANYNDIFDNTDFGVTSTNAEVDATFNYWGDASGPGGFGYGSGDAITDFVSFCPWLELPFGSAGGTGVGTGDVNLACNDLVHISLDENCRTVLMADMLLEGEPYGNEDFEVKVFDTNGNEIPNATLTGDYVGQTLTYHVTHECSGSTCWGELTVEDKLIPQLECRTDTIEAMCGESLDPEAVGLPIPTTASYVRVPGQNEFVVNGFDPCGEVWLTYSDEMMHNGCGERYYDQIVRTWKAVDGSGNETSCSEVLGVLPGSLDSITFPRNYDGINLFALECDDKDVVARGPRAGIGSMSVNVGWNSLDNGLPSPHFEDLGGGDTLIGTGYPGGVSCDHIAVSYKDRVIETCGPNTYKLFRTWKIYDWCTGEDTTHLQLIKVVDTRAPQLLCNPNNIVEVVPNAPWSCTGTFIAPEPIFDPKATNATSAPVILSECSNWTYEVRHKVADVTGDNPGDCVNIPTSGAFFTNTVRRLPNGQFEIYDMPFGCNWIEYIITDECGNVATCRYDVFVEDLENPVPVCDEHTVISLNEDGEAELCAPVLDNGSLDNCTASEDLRYQIKRMGESDAQFRDCIAFNCADVVISPIMVIFRVFDERDNFNDCMVEVEVQDKIAPEIDCPADIRITCEQDYNDESITGSPQTSDQCGNLTVTSTIVVDSLNDCGIGYVIKRWRVEDGSGRFDICDQRIDIYDSTPFGVRNITWPRNTNINGCSVNEAHPNNLPDGFGWPDYTNKECAKPVAGFTDEVYHNVNGNCLEIHRTWEVIDWCQYDIVNNVGPKWTHVQIIGVSDNENPVLETGHCENRTVCADADCQGIVEFNMTATDDCTPEEDLEWSYSVRDAQTNTLIESGTGPSYFSELEVGRYLFYWRVKDACGNEDDCTSVVTVEDCKEPTPYCKPGIITTIMPSAGYVEVWASDLDDGSFDNCTSIVFSFSQDTTDIVRRITCDSLANGEVDTFHYRMYVTDRSGNFDYCEVTIIVQDNQDRCPNNGNLTGMVNGLVKTTIDDEVESVEVALLHNDVQEKMMKTSVDGQYTFDALTLMDKYEVAPYKNDDHLNGVSTADLVMIQRHLLGLNTFTSAYQYIAADANNNQDVSASDISEVRKLILGAIPAYRWNTSWRFIDADQTFADLHNPWAAPLVESHTFEPLSGSMMGYDFVAVKVGDVNDSASPSGATSNGTRSNNELSLSIEDQTIEAGQTVSLPVLVDQDMDITGMQMTINLGQGLNIQSLESGLLTVSEANYHVHDNGWVTFSWDQVEGQMVSEGDQLFAIQVLAGSKVNLSEELSISSELTRAEAYDQSLIPHHIELRFGQSQATADDITLYQNIPNPFSASTVIPFELPQSAPAQLTVFDATGKVVMTAYIEGHAGYNEFELSTSQLGQSGVLYYQLESNQKVATKRMIYQQ